MSTYAEMLDQLVERALVPHEAGEVEAWAMSGGSLDAAAAHLPDGHGVLAQVEALVELTRRTALGDYRPPAGPTVREWLARREAAAARWEAISEASAFVERMREDRVRAMREALTIFELTPEQLDATTTARGTR